MGGRSNKSFSNLLIRTYLVYDKLQSMFDLGN